MNFDPTVAVWLFVTVAALLGLGVVEIVSHRRNLARIPTRVHVNGTRGKSSVTRLIAAGLRAGGLQTVAKVTGVLPRVILPDGNEYSVFRPAGANILEQRRIVALAAQHGAQVLVLECMALQPQLQWLAEDKLVRATHGVITNARADHLDVMGPGEVDVAKALAGMVPRRGLLFTCERRWLSVFREACDDRGSQLVAVDEDAIGAVTEADLAGFSYVEHPDNVALALRICAELGVDRETALAGMWAARPDPGVTVDIEVQFFGRRIWFVNGFAANDPESTERLWHRALERHADARKRIAIFNCRADRLDRSVQLATAYLEWEQADHVVLIGSGTFTFARVASARGLDGARLEFLEDAPAHDIFETLVGLCGPSAVIVGMGNIAGAGLELVRLFQNRSRLPDPSAEPAALEAR